MKIIYKFVGLVLLIIIWHLISISGIVDQLFLPTPIAVMGKLIELLRSSLFWVDIFNTLMRALVGFSLAILLGIPLGFIMGSSKKVYDSLEFIMDFFRSIPATALIPLFTLFLGIGDLSKIILVMFVSLLIIAFNVMYGVRHSKELRKVTGQLFGLSSWRIFTRITFPESMPYVFIGLRLAISSAFIVVVVSEMFIGTTYGLGHRIVDAQQVYDAPVMYSAIFTAGILAYIINKIFAWLEFNVITWQGK